MVTNGLQQCLNYFLYIYIVILTLKHIMCTIYMTKYSQDNALKKYTVSIPKSINKKVKIFNKDFEIPKFKEYDKMVTNDYNVPQLKLICTQYNILKTGKKDELVNKIYKYLYLSNKILNIQKVARLYLVNLYKKHHGPAYLDKSLCVNETDFIRKESEKPQFFSYKDNDGMIYGFNVSSLYEYIFKKKIKQPIYTKYNSKNNNNKYKN